jgi:hypothetical protein
MMEAFTATFKSAAINHHNGRLAFRCAHAFAMAAALPFSAFHDEAI